MVSRHTVTVQVEAPLIEPPRTERDFAWCIAVTGVLSLGDHYLCFG